MEPKLCDNGCGFFGSASTFDLCSKCFHEKQLNLALEKLSIDEEKNATPQLLPVAAAVRVPLQDMCWKCKKRLRIARGFKCRCGFLFCELHRYPEEHRCSFDYKTMGKYEIAKVNPTVKADKIQRI